MLLFRHSASAIILAFSFIIICFQVSPTQATDDKTLRVGIYLDEPPISFTQNQGNGLQVRGLAVDLAVLMGKIMKTDIKFQSISRSDPFKEFKNGASDFFCFTLLTDMVRKEFDFLEIGLVEERQIFVCDSCLTVTCIKDFPGNSIAYLKGDPFLSVLRNIDNADLMEASSYTHALEMIAQGKANVFVSPSHRVAFYFIEKLGLQNIRRVGVPIEKNALVIAVAKGNSSLLANLSFSLGQLAEMGSIDLVFDKWLGKKPAIWILKEYYKYFALAGGFILIGIFASGMWNYVLKKKVNKMTEKLSQSEKRYRNLIESSPDMIFMLNKKGEIIHANQAAKSEAIFKNLDSHRYRIHDFMCAGEKDEVDNYLNKILSTGYATHEFCFHYGDSTMDVEIVGTPIAETSRCHDETLICCFARDITERKRFAKELIHSERLAVIGKMAASMAHEINNPLGIILANAEELAGGELNSDDFEESLAAIQRNAFMAGKITEGLLTLAAPRPIKVEESFNLVDVINESLSFLKPKIKIIKMTMDFPEDGIWLNGDRRSIQQLFVNLLLNAMEAVNTDKKNEIHIHGRLVVEKDMRTARIVVKDNGRGIPRENLAKIFEPFFSQGKQKGFGLGLCICQRIVEMHDGIMFAESEPGKGTKMIVELKA